jgi:hypothetical protein
MEAAERLASAAARRGGECGPGERFRAVGGGKSQREGGRLHALFGGVCIEFL